MIAYYFMWRTGQPAAGQCEGDFMPWYSVQDSADVLLAERPPGRMYLACYLRPDDRVYETYWTTVRGVEAMDSSYALLDLTAHGRQETWGGLAGRVAAALGGQPAQSAHRRAAHRAAITAGRRPLRRSGSADTGSADTGSADTGSAGGGVSSGGVGPV